MNDASMSVKLGMIPEHGMQHSVSGARSSVGSSRPIGLDCTSILHQIILLLIANIVVKIIDRLELSSVFFNECFVC